MLHCADPFTTTHVTQEKARIVNDLRILNERLARVDEGMHISPQGTFRTHPHNRSGEEVRRQAGVRQDDRGDGECVQQDHRQLEDAAPRSEA